MSAKRLWEKGEAVDELVHRFTVGSDPRVDRRLVRWDAVASGAHARMLRTINILTAEEERVLLDALRKIAAKGAEDSFDIPIELEDCHTAIEAVLIEECGDAGRKIHTGRSRNDQVLVASRLALRWEVLRTIEALLDLAETLLARSKEIGAQLLPGYTHMQPAMPSSFGMWLQSIAEGAIELAEEGSHLFQSLGKNPLGAGSGFGVPLPLDRQLTADLLGFSSVQRNPVNVQNSRGLYELRALRWLSDSAALVEKGSWDLILFSSYEYGFVALSTAFTTGSSIMPQKRNPDVLELLRARAAVVRSAEEEVRWITAKLPSSYHRDFQLVKEPTFRGVDVAREHLVLFAHVIKGITPRPERVAPALTDDLYATYGVYALVKKGMPFREAYQQLASELKAGTFDSAAVRDDFKSIAESLTAELSAAETALGAARNTLQSYSQLLEQCAANVLDSSVPTQDARSRIKVALA